jgi:hypothetical protein
MLLLIWTRVFVRLGGILYVSVALVLVRCGLDDVEGGSGWCSGGEVEADDFGAAEVEVFWSSLADSMESGRVCAAMALVKLTVDEVDVTKCGCVSEEEGLKLLQAESPAAQVERSQLVESELTEDHEDRTSRHMRG